MKTPDISQSPLVRRYGVRGAKLFARLWFPFMYLGLVGLATGFWFVGPELISGWRRTFLGCLSETLIILAASLLTRMRLHYLSGIEMLEGTAGAGGKATVGI